MIRHGTARPSVSDSDPTQSPSSPPPTGHVLVVDDHASARESMAFVLREAGHEVSCCASGAEAIEHLQQLAFDCVVTDLQMPGMNGIELICRMKRMQRQLPVLMVTAHASVGTAVEAMRLGAFDYVEKPFDVSHLETLVADAIRHKRLLLPDGAAAQQASATMIGSSGSMVELAERIAQVAPTPETVLVHGESGTGKELVARAIHVTSGRTGRWVSVNCPALSAQLMESELFGHQRGAFTGADQERIGRFEMADGGTLLLDEVTEIDLNLQAKLLRVLQERSFERVGSSETRSVDVRVVATTNRNLEHEVAEGRFREDLYYRLAVVPVTVPPLRSRKEDVPLLVRHFLARCAARLGRAVREMDDTAMERLMQHDWPGNVRELENLVTRVSVLSETTTITADQLSRWLPAVGQATIASEDSVSTSNDQTGSCPPSQETDVAMPVGTSLEEMERRLIEATLEQHDGHRQRTAKALGIGVRTLTTKLRKYGYAPREKSFAEPKKG